MDILVCGIGGVGGYFGGLLAKSASEHGNSKVAFLARGEHAKAIHENGLELRTDVAKYQVQPYRVFEYGDSSFTADVVLLCSKAFDLTDSLNQCMPFVGSKTSLLALQNGVDHDKTLADLMPGVDIWQGCVHLVARKTAPGIVTQHGNVSKLMFGVPKTSVNKGNMFLQLLLNAGIDASMPENMNLAIWEKFLFISGIATLTAWSGKTIGEVLQQTETRKLLQLVLTESEALARHNGIPLKSDAVSFAIARMEAMPFDATSTLHSDIAAGHRNELETITGYLVHASQKAGLQASISSQLYKDILQRLE